MRTLRFLILAGAALFVLRQTPVARASSAFVGCVNAGTSTEIDWQCNGCCNNQSVPEYDTDVTDNNQGLIGEFYNDPPSCGGVQQTSYCQSQNPTCGSTNEFFFSLSGGFFGCCPMEGSACASGQCCPPLSCFKGSCTACVSYMGYTNTGVCGNTCTYACDGSCPDPGSCSYDSQCPGGTCGGGCCQYPPPPPPGGGKGYCEGDGSQCGCDQSGDACSTDADCNSDDGLSCDPGSCTCQPDYEDPIIVDLAGTGFRLTNVAAGVKFDFFGKRKSLQMAWTVAGTSVGWLALDRNGNGQIDNGSELFSNVTAQPSGPKKLGFRALADYDQRANGGNGDGVIDHGDAVFPRLLVWVDKNHNGVSEPGELLTMQQAGIQSISLHYTLSRWVDSYGNQFRYRSKIAFTSGVPAGDQYVYDVLLGTMK